MALETNIFDTLSEKGSDETKRKLQEIKSVVDKMCDTDRIEIDIMESLNTLKEETDTSYIEEVVNDTYIDNNIANINNNGNSECNTSDINEDTDTNSEVDQKLQKAKNEVTYIIGQIKTALKNESFSDNKKNEIKSILDKLEKASANTNTSESDIKALIDEYNMITTETTITEDVNASYKLNKNELMIALSALSVALPVYYKRYRKKLRIERKINKMDSYSEYTANNNPFMNEEPTEIGFINETRFTDYLSTKQGRIVYINIYINNVKEKLKSLKKSDRFINKVVSKLEKEIIVRDILFIKDPEEFKKIVDYKVNNITKPLIRTPFRWKLNRPQEESAQSYKQALEKYEENKKNLLEYIEAKENI